MGEKCDNMDFGIRVLSVRYSILEERMEVLQKQMREYSSSCEKLDELWTKTDFFDINNILTHSKPKNNEPPEMPDKPSTSQGSQENSS